MDENGNVKENPDEPTRKEKDEYIKRRDQFLADIYYKEIDYDAFLMKTEREENRYLRQLDQYVPCGAADG